MGLNRDIVLLRPLNSPPPHLLLSIVDGKIHQLIPFQFHSLIHRINRRQQLSPSRPLRPCVPRREHQAVLRTPGEAVRLDVPVAKVEDNVLHDAVGFVK